MDERAPGTPAQPDAIELTGSDRRHLRRLAHALDPVVQIGAAGVTPGVIAALDRGLRDHELVKVRITRERDERAEIAGAIAAQTHSAIAGLVGHVAVVYRPALDPDRRKLELPSARRPTKSADAQRGGAERRPEPERERSASAKARRD